jgi:hypothetical protein
MEYPQAEATTVGPFYAPISSAEVGRLSLPISSFRSRVSADQGVLTYNIFVLKYNTHGLASVETPVSRALPLLAAIEA